MIFKYKRHPGTKGSETIVTIIHAFMILGIGILGLYTSRQIYEEDTGFFLAWFITALVYFVISCVVQLIKSADTMYSMLAFTYNQNKGLYIYDVNDDSFLAGFNLIDYKIYPARESSYSFIDGFFSSNMERSRQKLGQNTLLKQLDKQKAFDYILNNGLEDNYGKRIYSIKEVTKKSNCIKLTYSYLTNVQNNFEREDVIRVYKGINNYKELYELLLKLKN